jgi:hypothetical protein
MIVDRMWSLGQMMLGVDFLTVDFVDMTRSASLTAAHTTVLQGLTAVA